MKQFIDFHTFKKVVRKYWKRHADKSTYYSDILHKKVTAYWTINEWCWYHLDSSDIKHGMLEREDVQNFFMYDMEEDDYEANKQLWKDSVGKVVNFGRYNDEHYNLSAEFIGFAIINNTVKYLVRNRRELVMLPFRYYIKMN